MIKFKVPILIACCAALVVIAIVATKHSFGEVAMELLHGSLGTPRAISGTLKETTPLLIAGVAVFFALRAGLFNIGVEGQFLVGALSAAVVALKIPGFVGIILAVLIGMIAGALWAYPAGLIKAYRGGHEVITTIMLNNVAVLLTRSLVAGAFKDPTQQSPTTASLPESSWFPAWMPNDKLTISSAILFGICGVILLSRFLKTRVAGYELRATGANPTAAKFAGIDTRAVTVRAMLVSGAIAGLAGSLHVLAYEHRFYADFSPGYGFDALGVALLAGASPWGLLPAALIFGALNQGAVSISLLGIPRGIVTVVLGLLIIVFAAIRYGRTSQHAS